MDSINTLNKRDIKYTAFPKTAIENYRKACIANKIGSAIATFEFIDTDLLLVDEGDTGFVIIDMGQSGEFQGRFDVRNGDVQRALTALWSVNPEQIEFGVSSKTVVFRINNEIDGTWFVSVPMLGTRGHDMTDFQEVGDGRAVAA